MLAEIFLLKLEAKARSAAPDDRSTKSRDQRFVPIAPRS
jgi:hypothetical protein